MIQHANDKTRWRAGAITSILDPIITTTPSDIEHIELNVPLEYNDHAMLRIDCNLKGRYQQTNQGGHIEI